MKKRGVFIILLLFIPGLLFMNYIGVFTSVVVEEKVMGPYQLVFKEHRGEYKFAGAVIAEAFKVVGAENANQGRGFGWYYDDPKTTRKDSLRSDAGILFAGAFKDSVPVGFSIKEFSLQKCLVVEYPNRNFLSVHNGIAKVYPKLFKYAAAKNYKKAAVLEIYEEKKIIYLMPVKAE